MDKPSPSDKQAVEATRLVRAFGLAIMLTTEDPVVIMAAFATAIDQALQAYNITIETFAANLEVVRKRLREMRTGRAQA